MKKTFIIISILFITISLFAKAPDNDDLGSSPSSISTIDLQTFINANKLLMFVTNRGSIGYDQAGVFGRNEGLYYPFIGFENPFSVTIKRSVVFAGGIWIAGVDNATGDTLVTVAEYSDDYWPGPMVGGTYHADGATNPSYRVYKIYKDSMSDNPNDDYLNWPVSDGAPVDNYGAPLLIGEQTLWSVFNDANPGQKLNSAGSVANPVGIEIQQTTWAVQEPGDIEIPLESVIDVQQLGNSKANVEVYVSDYLLLTGDDYVVVVDSHLILGSVWHLDNITENIRVLENQTDSTTIDGFLVIVEFNINETIFSSFQVVANGNGVLDPPVPGALGSQGFPTPGDGDPDNSQQVGEGKWALHTGDNGGSCNFGNRGSYDKFLERSMRGDNVTRAGFFDYEMRFTGDTNSSGEYDKSLGGGSVAIRFFQDDLATWVPFELWRTGINTPNDQSDDVRLIVWHLDIADDSIYNLEGYGCSAGPAGGEHSASPDDDDPLTDWIYWYLPVQDSLPGESGYNKAVAEILAGTYSSGDNEIIARTVLINVNSSIAPPFNQSLPEPGTIFRIENSASAFGPFPIDTFTFTANEVAPPLLAGADDLSIYTRYKLINKGGKNLKDFYICLWFDPDLGDAGDDLIGCDTVNNIFFCYNDGPDRDYGYKVPVFGGKVLEGPIVPSPGDVATVNGKQIPNYKNLEMTSFQKYINGTDPQHYRESYNYMRGLNRNGSPLANGSKYALPGDPVTGIGDIDINSSDRRMMPSFGPFDFAPGDTQQVFFKLSVGQGDSPLNSITSLKEILNIPYQDPVSQGKAIIEPDTLYAAFLHVASLYSIDTTMFVTIKIGNLQDGLTVTDINNATVRINGSIIPTAIEILPSHDGFVGQVMVLTFEVSDLINMHMPLYDTTVETFTVSGSYKNTESFEVDGIVIFRGHTSGDMNLDGKVDIADLIYLINYLFKNGPELKLPTQGDVNASCGNPNIADLTYFISYMFKNGASPKHGCE